MRCFHNTARGIITTQDNLQKEVDHLARVLKQNAFPANFIRNGSVPPKQETADTSSRDEEQEEERGPLVVILCVAGMCEDIRHICRRFNIRVVIKSRRTLCSMLTMVKDITYWNAVQCGISYPLQLRPGLHQGHQTETGDKTEGTLGCGIMDKSAEVEYTWENHHLMHWEETIVLDHGREQELLVKEALHIQMTTSDEHFNEDGGLEVPGCWTAVMKRQGEMNNLTNL